MRSATFILTLLATALFGALLIKRQHAAISVESAALLSQQAANAKSAPQPAASTPSPTQPPSSELLKLRSEVTLLRRQLDSAAPLDPLPRQQRLDEWAQVHGGAKLSEQPGFKSFATIAPAGNSTPDSAFETFQHAMRNQHQKKLTDTDMKRLWDLPDDFDDPDAKYSVDIGDGIGGEHGYKIAAREWVSTNSIRLVIDYENEDGSSFRRERILVERGGQWRLRPGAVRRISFDHLPLPPAGSATSPEGK